jgi:RNA polymerase sigma factor (sigma-70 family)
LNKLLHTQPHLGEAGQPSPFDAWAESAQQAATPEDRAAAFAVIYQHLSPTVKGFVLTQTERWDMVDDFVHDTFIKAMTKIDRFDASKGSFPHWINVIARNTVRNFHRNESRRLRYHVVEIGEFDDMDALIAVRAAAPDDTERIVEARETVTEVANVVRQLPNYQSSIVRLAMAGYDDNGEIAGILGHRNKDITKVRKCEAIKKVRTMVEEGPLAA